MSNNPTPDEVRASIVPNSSQLNADDLLTGPITVTIKDVKRGSSAQQPIEIVMDECKPFYPCKSMRRVLIAALGDDPVEWVGHRLTLFNDQSVLYAGVRVGGLRISAMSGIPKDMTFMLTATRGKKAEFHVARLEPLPKVTPPTEAEQQYIDDCRTEIEMAGTPEALKAIGFILKNKSEAVRNALRPAYDKRKKELESETKE